MGTKKIYSCNLCGNEYSTRKDAIENLIGLNYTGMRYFKLDTIDSTEGYHICIYCASQICEQAPKILEGRNILEAK